MWSGGVAAKTLFWVRGTPENRPKSRPPRLGSEGGESSTLMVRLASRARNGSGKLSSAWRTRSSNLWRSTRSFYTGAGNSRSQPAGICIQGGERLRPMHSHERHLEGSDSKFATCCCSLQQGATGFRDGSASYVRMECILCFPESAISMPIAVGGGYFLRAGAAKPADYLCAGINANPVGTPAVDCAD
jgi:hypothetical protein